MALRPRGRNATTLNTASDVPHSAEIVVIGTGYGGAIAASRLARAAGRLSCSSAAASCGRASTRHLGGRREEMQVEFADSSHRSPQRVVLAARRRDERVPRLRARGNVAHQRQRVIASRRRRARRRALAGVVCARTATDSTRVTHARPRCCGPERIPTTCRTSRSSTPLRRAAGSAPFERTPINVTFRADPTSSAPPEACNGCGDCVTAATSGPRTALDELPPDAVGHGAEIFTEVEVRDIEPDGDHGSCATNPRRPVATRSPPRPRDPSRHVVLAAVCWARPRSCSARAPDGSRCRIVSVISSPATVTCWVSRTTR